MWPDDCPRVTIGRLEIKRTTTVEETGDPVMMHDPTRLTDGIEAPYDPFLDVRRGVCMKSVANCNRGLEGAPGSAGARRFTFCNLGIRFNQSKILIFYILANQLVFNISALLLSFIVVSTNSFQVHLLCFYILSIYIRFHYRYI